MSNHVHFLCTPQQNGVISQMMQSLGRKYVRYFNYQYQRTGTLWDGRYKSCLVQAERYLLEVYRYIELNPVRADMVDDPADYVWSSYQINALGKESELCTPHPEYLRMGRPKNFAWKTTGHSLRIMLTINCWKISGRVPTRGWR